MQTARELLALLDALPVSVALWDRDVRLRYGNRRALTRFGDPPGGTPLSQIVRPDAVELAARYIQGALAGRPQQVERAMLDEHGQRVNAHQVFHIPSVVDGRVIGYLALSLDITASIDGFQRARRAREQAALQAERLRAADDLDEHNIVDELAGALRRLDAAAGQMSDVLPSLDAVVDTIEKATNDLRATFPARMLVDPAPPPRLAFPPMSGPIEGPDGAPGVGLPDDVTGAGWSPADLRRLLDLVPAAVAVWDRTHHNLFANRAAARWFRLSDPGDAVGRHASEIVGADGFAANSAHVDAALSGETRVVERSINGPDGVRHVQASYVPRTGGDERVDGVYIMAVDVTARVQAELALQDQRTEVTRRRERERIADSLHNLVIQRLFAASLAATLPDSAPDEQVSTVQDGLVAALKDIESALSTLQTAAPNSFDLLPALAATVHEAAQPGGISVAVETVGAVGHVPADVGAELLAECRRALTLAIAAPSTHSVVVTLAADEHDVRLRVVADPGGQVIDWWAEMPPE